MKQMMMLALCLAAIVPGGMYAPEHWKGNTATIKEQEEVVQMPNPFTDCETLQEAEKLTGFKMNIPVKIEGYDNQSIQVLDKKMIQVILENEKRQICIRKATGTEDISGDYNHYPKESKINFENRLLTVRGNDKLQHVVIWTDQQYTYSVQVTDGMDLDHLKAIVKEIQ